jgi:alginate O-acetyltransferase complex protein AlgI
MFLLSGAWFLIVAGMVLGHWLLPERLRGGWIVAGSAAFLAWLNPVSVLLLGGLTGAGYAVAGRKNRISGRALALLIALAGVMLIAFKIHAAINGVAAIDLDPMTEEYLIPLGLSYYALRFIHYAVEKYKGEIPAHSFGDFAQYMFFLPTFMAGPIHRYPAFAADLRRKRWDAALFVAGLERMLLGYFKIAFIANLLVNYFLGLAVMNLSGTDPALSSYLNLLKTGANLYFQFAGYSDIAIGFGMLLGFRVMENFNFPFLARNISDFWTRWHISLTSWCRDYVYMGVMASTRRAWLAAVSAMLVMGLWHEFSLRYLLWGVYHGVGILIWQQFQKIKPHLPQSQNKYAVLAWRVFSNLLTLHYVMFGMLLVLFDTPAAALGEWAEILLFWL